MKLSKVIAAVGAAGGLFAMNSAHAIAPLIAAGIAAAAGGAVGAAATNKTPPPPPVAVVPSNTVVAAAPATTVTEVVPAPREGYRWDRGHYELQNGVSVWVPGHWIADSSSTVIIQH